MKPRIVFVVMSAVHSVHAVAELARSLAPHTVLVHHDFAQTPDFPLDEPNIVFVSQPKRTGWGVWGYTQGVFHSLQFAVCNLEFDYVQFLSPTCLPIKPMQAFEAHVAARNSEADFAWIDLYDDRDALMSVAYRAFAPEHSLRHRMLRRLRLMYFGSSSSRIDVAGVQLRTAPATDAHGRLPWRARLALAVTRTWAHPAIGRHIFAKDFRPCFGSAWFGAHRHVIEWMIGCFEEPDLQRYFSRLQIPEELILPTMLRNSTFKGGPSNHCIARFNEANPKWLGDDDFDELAQSPAFFARKFPDDPSAAIRRRVLTELVGMKEQERTGTPVSSAAAS